MVKPCSTIETQLTKKNNMSLHFFFVTDTLYQIKEKLVSLILS